MSLQVFHRSCRTIKQLGEWCARVCVVVEGLITYLNVEPMTRLISATSYHLPLEVVLAAMCLHRHTQELAEQASMA